MGARLLVYPAFDHAEALADRFWRFMHYLAPAAAGVEEVRFLAAAPPPSPPPDYLDPDLPARAAALRERLVFARDHAGAAWDAVIVWDASRAEDAEIRAYRRVILDPAALHEGDQGIELGAELLPRSSANRARTRQRLLSRIEEARRKIVHVFGTGPSLASVDSATLAPGVSIVCNSLVKNDAMMDRLRPDFVVAVDPIFHAGPSRHAAVFRAHLVRALERLRPLFVVQERDAHIYETILPESVRDLLTPIPVRFGLCPNLDLASRFELTATRNVLTMAMLPLAAMLGEDVRLYGCDGRAPEEPAPFWSYDARSTFAEEARQQYQAHPGFFTLDTQDYYALHCGTVQAWIERMERRSVHVHAATPSLIPALRERALPGVAMDCTEVSSEFRAEIARAYRRRRMQAAYGAMLESSLAPRFAKRILRGLVAMVRRL